MRNLLLLLFPLLLSIISRAQAGEVYGTILDAQKQPAVGAVINVSQKGTQKGGAVTDNGGNYSVKPLSPGRYDVKISYAGSKTVIIQDVGVAPGQLTRLNFNLEANTATELEEVKIKYVRPIISIEKPGSDKHLTGEQISRMPTRSTNDFAAQNIGAYQQRNGAGSYLGGARTSGTAYLVDGVQVQGAYLNPSTEEYKKQQENDFMNVHANPLSTMSVDVDHASYTNVRRFINQGMMPPPDAVRVEEMVNYFKYHYPQPKGDDPIAITTETTSCPWNPQHRILHIGMQARTVKTDNLPPSNITFLIDVSGSMDEPDKLPLLKAAFMLLTDELRPQDRVSIVVYAGNAGLVLPPTPGNEKNRIRQALDQLEAGGSTAGGAGIELAYNTAEENFIKGGNNRVILATDGDFNVGISNDNELEALIVKEREKGIFLSCLGVGQGNYKDSRMEMLADKGNGNYNYIDNLKEAQKTLVSEFGGTLFTIAKDVKAQIEFNPEKVKGYRLVGYENRVLNAEDFKDDKKDAGDMGAGHSVTILYEIIPAGAPSEQVRNVDPLKYQQVTAGNAAHTGELATVKFRYKKPDGNKSREMVHVIADHVVAVSDAGEDTRFAEAVALFGMLLHHSGFKGSGNYDTVLGLAKNSIGADNEGYRAEFLKMVKRVEGFAVAR